MNPYDSRQEKPRSSETDEQRKSGVKETGALRNEDPEQTKTLGQARAASFCVEVRSSSTSRRAVCCSATARARSSSATRDLRAFSSRRIRYAGGCPTKPMSAFDTGKVLPSATTSSSVAISTRSAHRQLKVHPRPNGEFRPFPTSVGSLGEEGQGGTCRSSRPWDRRRPYHVPHQGSSRDVISQADDTMFSLVRQVASGRISQCGGRRCAGQRWANARKTRQTHRSPRSARSRSRRPWPGVVRREGSPPAERAARAVPPLRHEPNHRHDFPQIR